MRYSRKVRTLAKKSIAGLLTAAMVIGMLPMGQVTSAGPNDPYAISVGRMVYASSSVTNSDPTYAVDGTTTTRWESAWGTPTEWLYVDLGKVTQITGVNLYWEGAYAKAYQIQFSNDEENWETKYSTTTANGGNQTINVSGNARYVRIYMTEKILAAYGYSLYEFEVMGLDGITKRPADYGTNLAQNKPVNCSAIRDEWWMYDEAGNLKPDSVASVQASNAVDGNKDTSFTSYQSNNQWLYVDLGGYYEIGRVILKWGEDAGKIYDIQVSDNAQNWRTVYRRFDGYAELEENLLLYATNVRYVRMYGYTKVVNGSGFAIKELQVYPYKAGDEKKTYSISALPESQVVNKKKGSYVTNDMYLDTAKLPTYIDKDNIKMPVDSNDWWQSAMIRRYGNVMSTLPLKAGYSGRGLSVLTTTGGWLPTPGPNDVNLSVYTETTPDLYIVPENIDSSTAYDRVHDYSDYTVDLQLCDADGVAMTSTHVKGSPYIYCDFTGRQTVYITATNLTSYFNDAGNAILTSNGSTITTDHIGIHVTDTDNEAQTKTSSSYYCITLPAGTTVKNAGGKLKITFAGADKYMSVGTMLSKSQLNEFYQHGYAFVTDSSVTYAYNEAMSEITSRYNVTTQVKRGGFSNTTMQLMLPHQWKLSSQNNTNNVYPSIRGNMHGVWNNTFTTVDTFEGLLPNFAIPQRDEFDTDKVMAYLATLDNATAHLNPAADAYWEGKNVHPLGMGVLMADQLGETELRDEFLKRLKERLVDWFTYDGEGDVSFLTYDKHWGTIYYSQSEFGANWGICDHHFTYGYFLFGATVLATYDKEFYNDYKDMIEILIRDYANPSGTDSEYCRFRAYDLYEGHSWAGGYADNDNGNNQESASESLFSWVSLYLWGVLTENDTYRDAGVFGFKNEMEAVKQYWFDYDGDNWVNDWPYEVVGQVYGGSNFYGTFFGGQPLYVYGIQWLPISEYLTYYGMNQQRAAEIYAGLERDTDKAVAIEIAKGEITSKDQYATPDNGWQHITWPFLSQTNPGLAMQKFLANDTKVQTTDQATTYWFIQSMEELGYKVDDIIVTGDVAGCVYYNKYTGKYTAQVWNPTDSTKVAYFKVNGNQVGTATIGAKALVSFEVSKSGNFNIIQAETPDISVPTGTYDDTKYVTISSKTPGATIYYTTDGSRPTTSSKVYNGVFAVSSTATVKAIAVKNGCINSAMASSTITVNGTNVSKNTNLASGKNATASSSENPSVDATKVVDNDASTRWSSDFNDNEWIQIDLGGNYTINKVTLDWEASYASAYKIQTSTNGNNWNTVYETTSGNGGDDEIIFTATNARYVRMQGVKRALAYGYSLWEMGVYEAATVAAPTFSLPSGTYSGDQTVSISSATKGVEIRYTTDGSTPNENSALYVPSIKIGKNTTIKAIAYRKGMITSSVSTVNYTINGGSGQNSNVEGSTGGNPVDPGTGGGNSGSGSTDNGSITTGKINVAGATASGVENDAMSASNAIDGNTGTRWASNYVDDANITLDLGATYSVSKVVLLWEAAYGSAYKIQVSTDGNNWNTVKTLSGQDGGEDVITFQATNARYVRMQGVTRALPYGYSLWEMEVYGAGSGSSDNDSDNDSDNGNTGNNPGDSNVSSTTNIALNKNVTVSGSESDGTGGNNAVDGNEGSRWSSNFADDAWIAVDLGATYSVNKVVLKWEGAYGSAYKIQVSTNGSSWSTVATLSGQDGGEDVITFSATSARYVRMQGVTRALPYGYSLWEMEVYASGSSNNNNNNTNQGGSSSGSGSTGGTYGVIKANTATASGAESDGMAAVNAVDGNTGSRWSSNFDDNAWITVDLGKTYSVDKVVLNWEGAYGSAYKIQVSTNGSNWTTVKELSGQDGGEDVITFSATNARYVRMQGVTRALPYGYSLWEMQVYGK